MQKFASRIDRCAAPTDRRRTLGLVRNFWRPPDSSRIEVAPLERPAAVSWDFGRLPVLAPVRPAPVALPAPGVMQRKLMVARTDDPLEREADCAAERVVELPEAPASDAAGRVRGVAGAGRAAAGAPPAVFEALASPARALEPETRAFMEPRFAYDFSRVRVHTDANAAESARAVDALAYTVGNDVVFGAGQYAPRKSEGQRLLAHELTHVVQQTAASHQGGSNVLQRRPEKPTQAERRSEQQLEEWAGDPGEAHKVWKKLSATERVEVTQRMARRYGAPFAREFLDVAAKGDGQQLVIYWQPGVGPNTDQLSASGYRKAGTEQTGNTAFEVEVWVHPSGKTVRRDVSTWKFGVADPTTKPGTNVKKPPTEGPPVEVPPVEPPITTARHETALDLLEDMHRRNRELDDSCAADPFPKEAAEDAQINWVFSREELRKFNDLDWSAVYPDFQKELNGALDENIALRRKCCKRDPSNYWFDCDTLPATGH